MGDVEPRFRGSGLEPRVLDRGKERPNVRLFERDLQGVGRHAGTPGRIGYAQPFAHNQRARLLQTRPNLWRACNRNGRLRLFVNDRVRIGAQRVQSRLGAGTAPIDRAISAGISTRATPAVSSQISAMKLRLISPSGDAPEGGSMVMRAR